ncbi:MAG: ABC-F family ATP-binding cassette domain-containing protein [Synergistaceae bacterium]|nr:ABC-F family ATP-binding cassette domain-containing protein [Synergistaceae bacterium]
MIHIKNLSLAFRERIILKNINWLVGDRSRVGLVGDNGAGKTTLLRILAGEIVPDDGGVEYAPNASIGYLPQDLAELGNGRVIDFLSDSAGLSALRDRLAEAERTVSESAEGSRELARRLAEHEDIEREFSHRGGYEFESTAKKVLRGLGFAPEDSDRLCGEFSGGWRMRLALAAVLLRRPDILLLDEPTNHLDSESMEWLEGWLRDHRGIMIFVSHDRRFLDKMASEIAEIARGEITRYSMGYERYIVEREAARVRRERMVEDQREHIEQIQRFVERFRYKASKAAQVQSRIKQLEKMEIYETDPLSKGVHIKFPEARRCGYEVMTASGLSKSYGGHEVFSNLDLEIHRGQRVALVGVNGAGKSTLLRILSGAELPDGGNVKLGHNVRQAYFSQESAQNLNYAHTLWEEACRAGSAMTEAEKRNLLGSFLFSGDDIKKPIRVLSGGEKSRVALFKLLLSDSNFLILDEPTNHLDMNTREMFQRALLQYGGTLLIVSHDRYFLDDLADRVVEIRDGRLYDYPGNYSWFIGKREEAASRIESGEAQTKIQASAAPEHTDSREKRRLEAVERNRVYREKKIFIEQIERLEARIASNEARRDEIDRLLCLPEALSDSAAVQSLMIERKSLEESIAADYAKWENLSVAMEAVK